MVSSLLITEVGTGFAVCIVLLAVLYTVTFLGMATTTVTVTKSDPTDPTVYLDR